MSMSQALRRQQSQWVHLLEGPGCTGAQFEYFTDTWTFSIKTSYSEYRMHRYFTPQQQTIHYFIKNNHSKNWKVTKVT